MQHYSFFMFAHIKFMYTCKHFQAALTLTTDGTLKVTKLNVDIILGDGTGYLYMKRVGNFAIIINNLTLK